MTVQPHNPGDKTEIQFQTFDWIDITDYRDPAWPISILRTDAPLTETQEHETRERFRNTQRQPPTVLNPPKPSRWRKFARLIIATATAVAIGTWLLAQAAIWLVDTFLLP